MRFSLGVVSPGARVISTWNPADKDADIVLSNANRTATLGPPSGTYNTLRGAVPKSSGKWVFDVTITSATSELSVGIANVLAPLNNYLGVDGNGLGYYSTTGEVYRSGVLLNTLPTYGVGDVISCAWDAGSTSVWFAKNGTWSGDPVAGTGSAGTIPGILFPAATLEASASAVTIGATLTYPAPTGFLAWI